MMDKQLCKRMAHALPFKQPQIASTAQQSAASQHWRHHHPTSHRTSATGEGVEAWASQPLLLHDAPLLEAVRRRGNATQEVAMHVPGHKVRLADHYMHG